MNNKHRGNSAGISLVELIVVISIMAVLGGVLSPQVVRYVASNRTTACKTNREAILAIYERCVYQNTKELKNSDLVLVLEEGDAATLDEVRQYKDCPSGGNYSGRVVENTANVYTAVIECDDPGHEDVVSDFIGWSTSEVPETTEDVEITQPSSSEEEEFGEDEEEEESSTVVEKEETYWPGMDSDAWEGKRFPGQYVEVAVPSGLQTSEDGYTYVIIDKNNSGTFKVYWEWNLGPDYVDERGRDQVVYWNGVLIEDLTAFKHPWRNKLTGIYSGNIVVYEGVRYIYVGNGDTGNGISYPIPGKNGNGFYLIDPPKNT